MGEGAFESIRKAYGETVAWWRALDEGAKQLYLKSSFPLAFSYNSGKIENDEVTFHDTKEIFEHGRVVGFTGDPRTIFEIANLKTAWREALGLGSSQADMEPADLLRLHGVLTAGTYDEARWAKGERPGSFKLGDYVVADGVGYAPEGVEQAISELLGEINEALPSASRDDVRTSLVISCYAHAKLVEIHPFADGNGRTARLLQNICLIKSDCPPLIVREQNRMAYYGALDAFHAEGDLDSFIDFCVVESVATWRVCRGGSAKAERDEPR